MRTGVQPSAAGLGTKNMEIINAILKVICEKDLLIKGEMNDHFAIMQLLNTNGKLINPDFSSKLFD